MSVFANPISPLIGTGNALDAAQGKVALVVNVASKCGLTPQYSALQAIHERYGDRGFTVLGGTYPLDILDAPNTTSAVTYKTQFNRTNGDMVVQIASNPSHIILMEVAE
jgi:glutathione peroxidase-family protein